MSENEAVPDEFGCNRSDWKQWRCKKRALEGKKMCETYTSQLTLKRRKHKAAAAESTVSRKGDEASEIEGRSKKKKRKRAAVVVGEAEAVDEAVRKMDFKRGDLQLDLIGMEQKISVTNGLVISSQKTRQGQG